MSATIIITRDLLKMSDRAKFQEELFNLPFGDKDVQMLFLAVQKTDSGETIVITAKFKRGLLFAFGV